MAKDNNTTFHTEEEWKRVKKTAECTGDPLTCIPSLFVSKAGAADMFVKCAKADSACKHRQTLASG